MSEYESNPYEAGTGDQSHQGYQTPQSNPLQIPAIILMVLSGLMLLSAPVNVVMRLGQMEMIPADQRGPVLIGTIVGAILVVVFNLLIIIGAINMLKLKKQGTAKMGAILACIPLCSPCVVLGIPFGIWALVTMGRPDVKAMFSE